MICADDSQLHRTSLRLLQAAMRAKLPGHLKLLLHTLCMHHNDEKGYAWPSIERLAIICSACDRTIQRQLGLLVQSGLIIIGRVPGIKNNAYAVQEIALLAIAAEEIKPAKNMLTHEELLLLQPTVTFGPTLGVTLPAPKGDISTPKGDKKPAKGDTHVTQTEDNGLELKKTEEGTETPAPAIEVGPPPAPPPPPTPPPPPVLASLPIEPPTAVINQPNHLDKPVNINSADNIDYAALQTTVDAINAQRISNGKKAMQHIDIKRINQEAIDAKITLMQALDWIMERPTRNFFHADFYTTSKPSSNYTANPPSDSFLNGPTPPAPPRPPPTPEQIAAHRAQKQQEALEREACRQAATRCMDEWRKKQATQPIDKKPPPLFDSDNLPISGPDWAMSIVHEFKTGQSVTIFRIEAACEALGLNYKTLRAERQATSTAETLFAPKSVAEYLSPSVDEYPPDHDDSFHPYDEDYDYERNHHTHEDYDEVAA